MLCKVSDSAVSVLVNTTILSSNKTYKNNQFYNSKQFDDTITIPSYLPSGNIAINVTYKMVEFSSGVAADKRIGTAKNGTYQNDSISGSTSNKTYTFNKSTIGGDTWRMYLEDKNTSQYVEMSRDNYINVVYTGNFILNKIIETHKSKPRQLKAIGENTTCTLFGYHTDNTRYNVENE